MRIIRGCNNWSSQFLLYSSSLTMVEWYNVEVSLILYVTLLWMTLFSTMTNMRQSIRFKGTSESTGVKKRWEKLNSKVFRSAKCKKFVVLWCGHQTECHEEVYSYHQKYLKTTRRSCLGGLYDKDGGALCSE